MIYYFCEITRCKLSKKTQNRLLGFFVQEVTARSVANIFGIHPNIATLFYRKISQVIAFHLAKEAHAIFQGDIEIDLDSKGIHVRGAAGKVVVFGMLKRHIKEYTAVVENTKTKTLMNEIDLKIKPDSVVYTDAYHNYGSLDVSEFQHHRINHSEEFANEKNYINSIENFWNQAKRILRKYNGIDEKYFPLFFERM